MPKKTPKSKTTIQIDSDNQKALSEMFTNNKDTYNNVISRLINNIADVKVDLIAIDNELPQLHTAIFQLGEDKESIYYFDGQTFKPITLKEANSFRRQPTLNMTITKEEAKSLYALIGVGLKYSDKQVESLLTRLSNFLETKE